MTQLEQTLLQLFSQEAGLSLEAVQRELLPFAQKLGYAEVPEEEKDLRLVLQAYLDEVFQELDFPR